VIRSYVSGEIMWRRRRDPSLVRPRRDTPPHNNQMLANNCSTVSSGRKRGLR
jgi:hypothetical protein